MSAILTPERMAMMERANAARTAMKATPMEFKGSIATLQMPPVPEPIDHRKEIAAIEKAVKAIDNGPGFDSISAALKAIAGALRDQSAAISKLAARDVKVTVPEIDLAPFVKAQDATTAALKALTAATMADRELVFDDDGQPIGLTSKRRN